VTDLKSRAKAFLEREVPQEISYVSGSIAEIFIRNYIDGKTFDAELLELGELTAMTLDEAIDSHSTEEAKEYFSECRFLIGAIMDQIT
jgi:hypothetical protein